MTDLINKLGNKTNSEGAGKTPEPQKPAATTVAQTTDVDRGDDLIAKANSIKLESDSVTAQSQTSSTESGQKSPKSASSTVEPPGSQTNSNDWSIESALKEVKKLREENKAYRMKYTEQLEKLKAESEARIAQKEAEMQALIEAKSELDKIKADQEDKKRDLTEKIAHREAKIAEMQAILEAREKEWKNRLNQMEMTIKQYEAERAAEAQVYQARLEEELSKIPEKYKEYANLLVKGAGEPRDALVALTEAKIKGIFEDRTVIVNHSVPGAHEGARSSKERLEEAERQRRAAMSSSQKISEALKAIRSGTPNSAFKTK
jgi:hypothetical protein